MFLNSLNDWLTTLEIEIQSLPGELDSVVARLDWGKLKSIRFHLEQEFDQTVEKHFAVRRAGTINLSLVFDLDFLGFRRITNEDLSRRREAYKFEIRVVIGKGTVQLMPLSEIADKLGATISQITPVAQRKGYAVLSWDQYQMLLDEIGKLIN